MTDPLPPPVEADLGASQLAKPPAKPKRIRTIKQERYKAIDLLAEAKSLRVNERICTGHVKLRDPEGNYLRDAKGDIKKRPCKNYAIKGGFVCLKHGGRAPQVRKKAEKRLLAMVEPSIIRLEALVHQEEHLPTALGAIRTVLERAGANVIGAMAKAEERDSRPVINIGIAVGGITKADVVVDAKMLGGAPIDAEVQEAG